MSLRPPRIYSPRQTGAVVDPLDYEIWQEKAATLGRATEAFERALAALQRSEQEDDSGTERDRRREALVGDAGEALFNLVIQREACGLRNTEAFLKEYRLPAAVRLRMGVARRKED